MFHKRDKAKAALAVASRLNDSYDELSNTTIGQLSLKVSKIELDTQELFYLLDEIRSIRNELSNMKNRNQQIANDIQMMFNEINIKTISNEKTALNMQTLYLRISIEIANNGIITQGD